MSAATAVYVAFGVTTLDLAWIPDEVSVLIVHNDDLLPETDAVHPGAVHIRPGCNVGFGAGVNLALDQVDTDRVVLCNPDTVLAPHHWVALVAAGPDEVVTLGLTSADGVANSVVNRYWNLPAFVGTALRLGRFVPRHGSMRRVIAGLLGSWGAGHSESLAAQAGDWPLGERWGSGAVLSLPTVAVRAVGGFDEGYFLYYEDADLQQRMAAHDLTLRIRLADVPAGEHAVGGSVGTTSNREVARIRRRSAARYAQRQPGSAWHLTGRLVGWTAR